MATTLTIRVVDIPSDTHKDFAEHIEAFGEVVKFSLAPSVSSIDDRWIATISLVDIDSAPEIFHDCVGLAGSTKERNVVIKLPESVLRVSVDAHFHGLTPLNFTKAPVVDIIAVTGLSAHAYGSWKARGATQQDMWLRDFLPPNLARESLDTRIMIYGYDSQLVDSDNRASIHDYAIQFLEAVKNSRYTEVEKHRPLILLGHSLGGLVIKDVRYIFFLTAAIRCTLLVWNVLLCSMAEQSTVHWRLGTLILLDKSKTSRH